MTFLAQNMKRSRRAVFNMSRIPGHGIKNFSSRNSKSLGFYNTTAPSVLEQGTWITGQVIDHSVDVNQLAIGDKVEPPYEVFSSSSSFSQLLRL